MGPTSSDTEGRAGRRCLGIDRNPGERTGVLQALAARAGSCLFPAFCMGCGCRFEPPRAWSGRRPYEGLCRDCDELVEVVSEPVCHACQRPMVVLPGRPVCPRCGSGNQPLHALWAACEYEGPVREAILAFKHRSRLSHGRPLARLMVRILGVREKDYEPDLVLAVPMHLTRLRSRGFNQAEVLARQVSRLLGVAIGHDVIGRRFGPPQQGLSVRKRVANVRRAFELRKPERILNRNLLLVDDVIATGATLEACARTLAEGRPRSIVAWAVARPPPG